MDWGLYAWLKRGSRRKAVLEILEKSGDPLSASDVKKISHIAISQASYTLKELADKRLVECINPKDNIGKLYRISEKGGQYVRKARGKIAD